MGSLGDSYDRGDKCEGTADSTSTPRGALTRDISITFRKVVVWRNTSLNPYSWKT